MFKDLKIVNKDKWQNMLERKGDVKCKLIYDFLLNELKLKNSEIDSDLIIEVYKFFIRIRRFAFKWINQIEDYFTSFIITIENHEEILNLQFFQKIVKLNESKDIFRKFQSNHKLYKPTKNSNQFKLRLFIVNEFRNFICHNDLFFLNIFILKKNEIKKFKKTFEKTLKKISINTLFDNLKYFIWIECAKDDKENGWESFDNQLNKIIKKENNNYEILNKILKYEF